MTSSDAQLERVLGPDWQRMSFRQLATRARGFEQAASFTRALIRYMDETDAGTAGEALDRLRDASASDV